MTNYQKRKGKNDEYRSKIMRFTFQLSLGDGEVRDWFEQQPEKGDKQGSRKYEPVVNPQKKENVVKKIFNKIFGFKK